MTKKINDSVFVRWSALLLIALMMFFCYMFVDVISPLQNMFETARGWTPETYGAVVGSEYFLNVFV
ncbi:MAG: MFS transporter, partial [Alistipes sp.]|nr:MFS transporter [Alistipes sp.]